LPIHAYGEAESTVRLDLRLLSLLPTGPSEEEKNGENNEHGSIIHSFTKLAVYR